MQTLTTVETVHEEGSWLFTVRDQYGDCEEVILVPCEDGVERCSTSSRPQADDSVEQSSMGSRSQTDDSVERSSTSSRSQTDDNVEAWINRCTHESQRFDTGRGAPMREGQLICPRHGSMFDACSGYCDNGEAEDTTLPAVDITVHSDGRVVLTDEDLTFVGEGGIEDNDTEGGDDGPASTSHIGF